MREDNDMHDVTWRDQYNVDANEEVELTMASAVVEGSKSLKSVCFACNKMYGWDGLELPMKRTRAAKFSNLYPLIIV